MEDYCRHMSDRHHVPFSFTLHGLVSKKDQICEIEIDYIIRLFFFYMPFDKSH